MLVAGQWNPISWESPCQQPALCDLLKLMIRNMRNIPGKYSVDGWLMKFLKFWKKFPHIHTCLVVIQTLLLIKTALC